MMLSSAAQHSDAERCRSLGVAAYFTKPIKQSELLDTILSLLDPTELCATQGKLVLHRQLGSETTDRKHARSGTFCWRKTIR